MLCARTHTRSTQCTHAQAHSLLVVVSAGIVAGCCGDRHRHNSKSSSRSWRCGGRTRAHGARRQLFTALACAARRASLRRATVLPTHAHAHAARTAAAPALAEAVDDDADVGVLDVFGEAPSCAMSIASASSPALGSDASSARNALCADGALHRTPSAATSSDKRERLRLRRVRGRQREHTRCVAQQRCQCRDLAHT
jgi:hypothetical protein